MKKNNKGFIYQKLQIYTTAIFTGFLTTSFLPVNIWANNNNLNNINYEHNLDKIADFNSILINDEKDFQDIEKITNDVSKDEEVEAKLIIEKGGRENEAIKETDIILYSNNTTAFNSYKKNDDIKMIRQIELPDNLLMYITGKVFHNNKIYYRAEIPHSDAKYHIDNYLDLKDDFNINDPKSNTKTEQFVFYIDGNEVMKDVKGEEEIDKTVYAKQDTHMILLDGKASEIMEIKESEGVKVVKENNLWYFIDLKETLDNYDELNVEEEYAIIKKRHFTEDEFFTPEYKVLEAKEQTDLYTEPNKNKKANYHVKKGNTIIQLEKSANWIKIKLDSGEELYAPINKFDKSDRFNNKDRTKKVYKVKKYKPKTKKKVVKKIPTKTIKRKSENGTPIGEQVAEFALQFQGGRYVWGGNSLTHGVDCSGFTREVYKRFGVTLGRHTSQQEKAGRGVTLAEAKPGDLVSYPGHVGIYIGNGKIIHASNPRRGIIISPANYRTPTTVRRIFE